MLVLALVRFLLVNVTCACPLTARYFESLLFSVLRKAKTTTIQHMDRYFFIVSPLLSFSTNCRVSNNPMAMGFCVIKFQWDEKQTR